MVATSSQPHVRVVASDLHYLVPADLVVELVSANKIDPTDYPIKPKAFLGIANHRDHVLPLYDLASWMGSASRRERVKELASFLQQREQDHVGWLDELRRCVESGDAFRKPTDPTQCAFGKWYESLKVDEALRLAITHGNVSLEFTLHLFDEPHRRIHAIADDVLQLARTNKEAAIERIRQSWETDLAQMRGLFSRLKQEFADHVQGIYVVVKLGDRQAALLVESVPEVLGRIPEEGQAETGDFVTVQLPDGTIAVLVTTEDIESLLNNQVRAA